MKELDLEEDKPKEPQLMIPEWQAHLMEILEQNGDLTMLEDWPEEDAKRTQWLLMRGPIWTSKQDAKWASSHMARSFRLGLFSDPMRKLVELAEVMEVR